VEDRQRAAHEESGMNSPGSPGEVLGFWFEEIEPKAWWSADPELDERICVRFGRLLERAAAAELFAWRRSARGRLAEVIVLDQFTRNIHRGTRLAFAHDPLALALAQEAVAGGALHELLGVQRAFLLLPYMHSESGLIHAEAEGLFREFAPAENLDFELRHKAIIDRFGRYPHRNRILGRASTAEELAFLETPGSSF
jgi:uncharacterized protein (DUF924 family)